MIRSVTRRLTSRQTRSCIGRKVAYVEAILTVGLLCQKYKITPKEVNMKDVVNIITLAPLHPVKVCLEPR